MLVTGIPYWHHALCFDKSRIFCVVNFAPNNISGLSNLKTIVDTKINCIQKWVFFFCWLKYCGKGTKCQLLAFSPSPTLFSIAVFLSESFRVNQPSLTSDHGRLAGYLEFSADANIQRILLCNLGH